MKRFHVCPVLLLAASLLLTLTWWHSYRSLDRMYFPVPGGGCLFFTSAMGVLGLEYRNDRSVYDGYLFEMIPWEDFNDPLFHAPDVRRHFADLAADSWIFPQLHHYASTFWGELRYWQLLLVTLLWPLYHLLAQQFRRRVRQGLCPTCSYDLRTHTAGDKCPECGSPISFPAPKPAA